MNKQILNKRSQALLDFILVFGILLTLIVGFTRIWVWFNTNFAKRNVDYQNTRLAAGTANDSAFSSTNYSDSVLKIDDDWVFRGQASGSVGMPPATTTVLDILSGEGGSSGSEAVCASATEAATALRTQADNMDAQADKMYDFIKWGDEWYKPLFFVFMALGIDVDGYKDAIDTLREQADETRTQADSIQNTACESEGVSSGLNNQENLTQAQIDNAQVTGGVTTTDTGDDYTGSTTAPNKVQLEGGALSTQKARINEKIYNTQQKINAQETKVQELKDNGASDEDIAKAQKKLDNLNALLDKYIAYRDKLDSGG